LPTPAILYGEHVEPAIVTAGDGLLEISRVLAGRETYSAIDVGSYLTGGL
jgi:hypothetical protein